MANRPREGGERRQAGPVPVHRTRHTKRFRLDNGKQRIVVTKGPMHWNDGGELKEIDLTPRLLSNRFIVDQADYIFEVFRNGRFLYTSRAGGTYQLRIRDLGGPLSLNPVVEGREIRFNDIRPGLDLVYQVRPTGIRMIRHLKSDQAPKRMVFRVFESDTRQFDEKAQLWGWDSKYPRIPARRPLNLTRTVSRERPASGSRMRYDVTEIWTGEAGEIVDPSTRRREWQSDIVYPVVIYG